VQEAPFKIYNASAGSGKTHTLTKEYLKIVLGPSNRFKKILAITFTNKAVNEMKTRILDSLFEFGNVDDLVEVPPLFHEILKELELDAPTLRQRSKEALKEILHNYAFFDISTIDKFTHRIIRTFAKDLKIPQNFEVVLDTDLLLDEAIARLVHKAGTDIELTKVLLDFALEKIDDDRSWDITFDLFKMGKLIFRENHTAHLEKLNGKSIEDFLGLKKIIVAKIKKAELDAMENATSVLESIRNEGLQDDDFPRQTLPNHFKKITRKEFEPSRLYANKLEENLGEGNILKAGKILPSSEFAAKLLHSYLELKELMYYRSFLKNVYGNIVPLTVLNAIQKEVKNLQVERDQLSISEFNTLISREIKNQPAPFIYERLGEKYRHYFIDEFQDTSTLQWNNLIPLVGNALESEDVQGKRGSVFLVGDAKQAIYRWRGGRAEQFLNLVGMETNPFVIAPETHNLPTNFRSNEEVIKFNNDFFTNTSIFLNNALYNAMFVEGNQQHYNAKKGGTVQLTFIEKGEKNNKNELYCEEVVATIYRVAEKNYRHEEICILVRGNKEGVLLADYLTQRQIPTISSESLLINSSDKVRFLVNLMRHIDDPRNGEIIFDILSFLSKGMQNRHSFIHDNLKRIPQLLKDDFGLEIENLRRISVYDGMELAIKQFELVSDSNAYITYFMDVVLEVEQKEGTGIQTFLKHWEKKKEKLSITAPENVAAVRIMTIHKAKGLEFPIVIFPFANENIYKRMDKKLWLPLNPETFNGFEEVLVNEKKEVTEYSHEAAQRFNEEEHRMELDALNVLYVALTRAEKALYIISEKDLTSKGEHKTDFYSGLFIDYLKNKGLWVENESVYTFGELERKASQEGITHLEKINFGPTYKDRAAFRILTKSGMLWDTAREDALSKGNRIHFILGLIETEKDINPILSLLLRNGDIVSEESDVLKAKLKSILQHPDLSIYYKEGNIVKNEREIITKTGKTLRPDRIVLKGNYATIIDYKTGKRNPKYKEQLYSYADALTDMGYGVDKKIIIYINEEIVPEFI